MSRRLTGRRLRIVEKFKHHPAAVMSCAEPGTGTRVEQKTLFRRELHTGIAGKVDLERSGELQKVLR